MTKPVPQRLIVKSYFWPHSAEEVVLHFKRCGYRLMAAAELRDRWMEEALLNPVMRSVGDRPLEGFKQTDKIKLAEGLAV